MEMQRLRHYPGDLEQMQSLPLEIKITMTKRRIREWYETFGGNVYVSFSGGKDSTVLLHIARQIYPEMPAVFCNTGLEYPEIREFAKTAQNVTEIRPKINFRQVILKYGYPVISKETAEKIYEVRHTRSEKLKRLRLYGEGHQQSKISEKWKFLIDAPFEVSSVCCDVMKKSPFHRYEKETGNHAIIATMATESSLRKQSWQKYGCNAFEKSNPQSRPMSFWTEHDVLQYIKDYKIPYCSVYGNIFEDKCGNLCTTGCSRTGCMFCMFGVQQEKEPNRFQRMKETHTAIYNYCMKPIEEGGLGIAAVLDFIGVPR